MSKRFALIQEETVWQVLEAETLPPFHPALEWIEITEISPAPQERWAYDRKTQTFSAPPPPPPPDTTRADFSDAVDAALSDDRVPGTLKTALSRLRTVLLAGGV